MTCRNKAQQRLLSPSVGQPTPKQGVCCTTKGRGRKRVRYTQFPVASPIFLFCMPAQGIVCSTQMASNQFWSVMRANKLPRLLAVPPDSAGGMSRSNFSFLLCLFPPLETSLIFGPTRDVVYKKNESKERLKPDEFHSSGM